MTPDLSLDMPHPVVTEFGDIERELTEVPDRAAALATQPLHDRFVAAIARRMEASGCDVLSLDVFDTLLLRDDHSEAERYWDLSRRIARDLLGEPEDAPVVADLYLARCEGMELAYRFSSMRQGTLEGRIEDVLAVVAGVSDGLKGAEERMLDIEVEAEAECLAPCKAILAAARAAVASGRRVILISDMYLGAAAIRRIAEKVCGGSLDVVSHLFSSADTTVNKRSGTIFPLVAEVLDRPDDAFLHMGDSLEGDFRQPRAAGWRAHHFPVSEAELGRRRAGLDAFVLRMAESGLDVSRWAKV